LELFNVEFSLGQYGGIDHEEGGFFVAQFHLLEYFLQLVRGGVVEQQIDVFALYHLGVGAPELEVVYLLADEEPYHPVQGYLHHNHH